MFRGTRRKDVFTPFSLYELSLFFFSFVFSRHPPPFFAFVLLSLALQPQNHRFVVIVPLPFSPILSLFKHTRARFERKVRISTFPPVRLSLSLRLFFISSPVWGRENTSSALLNRDENFFFERENYVDSIAPCRRVSFVSFFRINFLSLSLSCSLLNEESEIGRSRAKR